MKSSTLVLLPTLKETRVTDELLLCIMKNQPDTREQEVAN